MALEEADLVLAVDAGSIRSASLDAEMIPDCSGVDRGCCLRDQLSAAHGLAIPVRSGVEGELCAFRGASICGVLVAGVEVYVFGDSAGSVDVVLVWTDLVTP
jgi:hypothetical protein